MVFLLKLVASHQVAGIAAYNTPTNLVDQTSHLFLLAVIPGQDLEFRSRVGLESFVTRRAGRPLEWVGKRMVVRIFLSAIDLCSDTKRWNSRRRRRNNSAGGRRAEWRRRTFTRLDTTTWGRYKTKMGLPSRGRWAILDGEWVIRFLFGFSLADGLGPCGWWSRDSGRQTAVSLGHRPLRTSRSRSMGCFAKVPKGPACDPGQQLC